MNTSKGANGLILKEPLLWEKGQKGRSAFSLPAQDVPISKLPPDLTGEGPDFPDLYEADVARHFTRLSSWNFGVDSGMYPLGSCTMKYNPKTDERQAALSGFTKSHPMVADNLCQGALKLIFQLERFLAEITGLDYTSVQPGAGAHGELAGMLIIHAYHRQQNSRRLKIIIPDTAHGTNPASAALCGYTPILIKSGPNGILEPKAVAAAMDGETAGIMVTNPNTLGLFEGHIQEIADIVHKKGGLVYCDGANMNAVMGMVDMKHIGIDLLHLNLHKTFSTPHGGGGPGSGPICVTEKLAPFLPIPRVNEKNKKFFLKSDYPLSIGRLIGFNGHFTVLVKAYSYILSMGESGLKKTSQLAVLNANYIKEKLKSYYYLPFDKPCMHECVFSDKFQQSYKVTTQDIAKRLIDYGFHPPTVYFPLVVSGAIMVEPTETESKEQIDLFITAMQTIAKEAKETPEVLKNSPHYSKVTRLDEAAAARKPCLSG
jgi:glycine dehydrogenase subunit 2